MSYEEWLKWRERYFEENSDMAFSKKEPIKDSTGDKSP
jgi:hypothetical protein